MGRERRSRLSTHSQLRGSAAVFLWLSGGARGEMHGQLAGLLDNGPWRAWNHQGGGAYLLRGERMGEAERALLAAVARAC
jgi:hypothetical protein